MNEATRIVDLIVRHHPKKWRHRGTNEVYSVVWASAREVASVSENHTWLGRAWDFIREFEEVDEL